MDYVLAALPILVVLFLMLVLRWRGQTAGPMGWVCGIIVAAFAFGLTPSVLAVSQLKGLFLSLFVLAVLWPALFLYNIVAQAGGIQAIARALECTVGDRGLLLVVMAWAFSGMLEGLAGFGLPIAIVAPMLVALDVAPVTAVAAVAVGHAWSVTFGDMGVIFQTLTGIVHVDGAVLAPPTALMLGVACLACGLGAALILGQAKHIPLVMGLGLLVAATQFILATAGITPIAALGAGLVGVIGAIIVGRSRSSSARSDLLCPPLISALTSYGALAALMTLVAVINPLRAVLDQAMWQMWFPEVATRNGFITPAERGQAFRFLTHPGTSIFLVACASSIAYSRFRICEPGSWRRAAAATWQSAAPSSIGILAMVGLAALMDHTGMTLLLARFLSNVTGTAFPLVSPLVGILGSFATGSNNNSNVLFANLQQNAARMLGFDPNILIAAQTTGGSLGSMIAPAKIIVGCSTLGLKGGDGEVLRRTLPYGLMIGLALGALALVLTR